MKGKALKQLQEESDVSNIAALTEFCVQNEYLAELSGVLAEFNMFEAAGLTRDEQKHSRFLAFLLNPKESHGLGETILTRSLQDPQSKAAGTKWNRIYRAPMVSSQIFGTGDLEKIVDAFDKAWAKFIEEDMDRLGEALERALKEGPS